MSSDTVAVITGGASGIGFALAKALRERCTDVVIADVDEDALARAADRLAGPSARIHTCKTDVCDEDALADLARLSASLGTISVVCLNAGVTSAGSLLWETLTATYDFVTSINLGGLFSSIRAFVPALIAQGTPAAVEITASMAGLVAGGYSAAYAAGKAGAISLAKSLRAELAGVAPFITVSVLNPGMVKTNLMRTSAARVPSGVVADAAIVEGAHAALNEAGVDPDVVARWVLDAFDNKRFWVLPPTSDPFIGMLLAENAELGEALNG